MAFMRSITPKVLGSGGGRPRTVPPLFCYCGYGKKRYVIALLCSIGLTVVIGMRSEMVSIINNLENNDTDIVQSSNVRGLFTPKKHRAMPWTDAVTEDLVENSVFFAYLIASPVGGWLTVHHDSSLLLGCSVAMTAGINLFLPLVQTMGKNIRAKLTVIFILRLLQGMAEGCLIPAVFGVLRFWCPKSELSTLLCLSVIGVSLGPLIGLPVCAIIESKWGWGVVFYIYANCGLIWCIFWWRMVDERPSKDKNLHKNERYYLESSIEKRLLDPPRDLPIPWRAIFTSRPVYAIFFTYAADDWTFQISSVCMQTFYMQIFNADVEKTIFYLSFPFLSRSVFVAFGGFAADLLLLKTNLTLTTIRKLLAALGFGLKAIFFVAMGYAENEVLATILLSMALGFSGLAVAGYAVNVIDLAPNFCGLVMGFANSLSTFTGILSTVLATVIVKHLVNGNDRFGWQIALCVAGGIQIISMVVYIIFGSCDEQPWSHSVNDTSADTTNTMEMQEGLLVKQQRKEQSSLNEC